MVFTPDKNCIITKLEARGTFAKDRWFAIAIQGLLFNKTGQKHNWSGLDLIRIKFDRMS